MKILVEIKNVYGEQKIYPRCEVSKLFSELSGNKTLTKKSIELIKQLGYKIEVLQQTL